MRSSNITSIYILLAMALAFLLCSLVGCQVSWPFNDLKGDGITPYRTPTLTLFPKRTRIWPGPIETPATPIPPPVQGLSFHSEVESIILLGLDQDHPFAGRSDAIHLILYNRRTSMASILSIPPDLFVYIPGYTMQRINSAYPLGGIGLVKDTLEYNLGIIPDHYLVVQSSDFPRLINAVGGIDVVVIDDLTDPCGLTPGMKHLNGEEAYCFASHRKGEDDIDRNRRQLQVMRAFHLRMIEGGQVARIFDLYKEFYESIQTDLTLMDLVGDIPMAIMLVDPQRVEYFQISWDEVTQWIMPGRAKTLVYLPRRDPLLDLIRAAIDNIMTSVPLSDLVITLQAQLTMSPLASITVTPSSTLTGTPTVLTATISPYVTPTPYTTTPVYTETPTPTSEGYPIPYP